MPGLGDVICIISALIEIPITLSLGDTIVIISKPVENSLHPKIRGRHGISRYDLS